MKLAYWPGCVSRGFTTELHGSVELVAESWASSWSNSIAPIAAARA